MQTFKRVFKAVWATCQPVWKAVVGLAVPIAVGALSQFIDAVGNYLQLNFGTSVWIGVATGVLVWLKRNLPKNDV